MAGAVCLFAVTPPTPVLPQDSFNLKKLPTDSNMKKSKLFSSSETLAEVLLGTHVTYRHEKAQRKSSWA